ncbi:MAG: response regulator [Chloroflexaceae bacterium]|nr:response regulator [Chloroflexaceae bacterium]
MPNLQQQRSLGFQLTWRVAAISLITVFSLILMILAGSLIGLLIAQQQLRSESATAARTFDLFLQDIGSSLVTLGTSMSHTNDPDQVMQDVLERYPSIFEILIIDPAGNIMTQQRRLGRSEQTAIAAQPWLETVKDGRVYWGEVDNKTYGVPFMEVAIPLHGHDAHDAHHEHQPMHFTGTLLARLDLSTLWNIVASIQVGDTGYAYLMHEDGQLLAYRDMSQLNTALATQASNGTGDSTLPLMTLSVLPDIRTGLNDQMVVSSAVHLTSLDWISVVEQPVTEALQPFVLPFILTLLLMVVVFAVVTSIFRFTQRKIVQPLLVMHGYVLSFQDGNLHREIPVSQTEENEMTILASTFNRMAHQLDALIDTLEQQVAERTAQLNQALKAAEEARHAAEEANTLKTRFIANMSHELRTPLNSIINFTQIIKSGFRGPVTEEQIQYLNRVSASGEHLLGLINDILDLSKIEAGRMELFKEELDLGELVESTMSTAIGLTKEKPIELYHEIAPDLPMIQADRTRIRQILLNLLSNAAKFTDEGCITVQVWQEQHELIVSITDTGIGIAPDKLETIFEEFRQADEGSMRSYEGTGLGLSICRRLLQMHGGRIWVESTPGVGSIFFFSLPLHGSLPTSDMIQTPGDLLLPESANPDGVSIMVIDNDAAVIEIVASYLAPDGYSVTGITDSRNALEETRRIQPAAIILDILMPHKDGWQLLVAFKEDPALQHIPIICYTIIDDKSMGLSLGASAYLVKPVRQDALRQTVKQLVGQQAHILVIDDDPDVREMLPCYLDRDDYHVTTAVNGQDGLNQIALHQPDLVILDLMMPVLDGFEVLHQLDQDPATRHIPIIVLTAKELTPDEQSYLQLRVQRLVQKRSNAPDTLLRTVQSTLRWHTHPTPLLPTKKPPTNSTA